MRFFSNILKHKSFIFVAVINFTYYGLKKFMFFLKALVRSLVPKKIYHCLSDLKTRFGYYVLGKKVVGPRVFLKNNISVESYFKYLKENNANYVVLRWFEGLPNVEKDEDIDILVADEDIDKVLDLCVPYNNGGQKIDVYSASGDRKLNYNGVGYYPALIANQIIDNRVSYKDLYSVPCQSDHYYSMLYHVAFHKGLSSGLKVSKNAETNNKQADHNYEKVLEGFKNFCSSKIKHYNLDDIYRELEDKCWVPEVDTLRILSKGDSWLEGIIDKKRGDQSLRGDVIVFIIREWAVKNGKVERIIDYLKKNKLDVISVDHISELNKKNAVLNIRGGQWSKGEYPVSGGEPCLLITVFDYRPKYIKPGEFKSYEYVRNKSVFVKHKIRSRFNNEHLFWDQANFIHSSDDEVEAWNYINEAAPERVGDIKDKVDYIRSSGYFHDYNVVKEIVSNGTRSKTEIVMFQGNKYVMKTFKPGCERFFERELYVYKNFSKHLETIPNLVRSGSCWFMIEHYDDVLKEVSLSERKRLVKEKTKEIMDTLKFFYDRGFAILGFYPGNLILDKVEGLKIIDFEFLYAYENKPLHFSKSFDIVGVPQGFKGDMPLGDSNHTIENTWKDFMDTGILNSYFS